MRRQPPAPPDNGPNNGDDDTIRLPRARVYGRPPMATLFPAGGGMPPIIRTIAIAVMLVVGVVGWFVMRERVEPPSEAVGESTAPVPPAFFIRIADEAAILAHEALSLSVFRFAANPRVLVLDFPTLLEQGRMLNRAAALVEKIGLPRNRVLNDAELDTAIAAAGDTMETFYYGHDYATADLARFFILADRDGLRLRPEEERLRTLLAQEGLLAAGAVGALISLPRVGSSVEVDGPMRSTILRHELSHAEFFSNPAYAAYSRQFWLTVLDDAGRAAFRRYLTQQNYDPALEDLMVNEMQAYLMHTHDTRLFNAASLGVSRDRLAQWQAAFLLGMPNGWLRDHTVVPARPAVVAPTTPARSNRPRRSGQRAVVSISIARALTRTPRRFAASRAA